MQLYCIRTENKYFICERDTRHQHSEGKELNKYRNDTLGGRKNDVNVSRRFPGNSSFCQAQHAFIKVWTPISTYRQFIICMFYFWKCHTKPDFVFKYHLLQFYVQCLRDSFTCGSFIVHVILLGTWKASTLSIFLPGVRVHVVFPGTQFHPHTHNSVVSFKLYEDYHFII